MALTRRSCTQGVTTADTQIDTLAFPTNPVSGDTIVVFMSTFASGGNTSQAPTDNKSNTYTQIGTTTTILAGTVGLSLWYSSNITGGSSFMVTGHVSATATVTVIATCLAGTAVPTSYNSDSVSATSAGGANPSIGPTTPAPAANSYFIAAVCKGGTGVATAGSGWQFYTNSTQTNNATLQDLYVEELTTTTASVVKTALFTNASEAWTGRIASFAPLVSASAVLTGTAVGGITEANVVAGGKVITITLTGDTFIPS